MKKLVVLSALMFIAALGFACEVVFAIRESSKKEAYANGSEVIFEIKVKLIHRNCSINIKDTKFTMKNMKVVGATEWKEVSPGVYTRQIKSKIVQTEKGDAKFKLERTCDLEGGYGVLTLKIAS